MINVRVSGALRVEGKDRFAFRPEKDGHAMMVMRLIQFLALEVMPRAVQADHAAHDGGQVPPEGFAGYKPEKPTDAPGETQDAAPGDSADVRDVAEPEPEPEVELGDDGYPKVPGAEDDQVQAYLQMSEAEEEAGVPQAPPQTGFYEG